MPPKSSDRPLVTIGVVTHNSAGYLPDCLAAIHAQSYPHLELLIHDNASDDGSADVVRDLSPEAEVVEDDRNLGYGAGHNRMIETSRAKYYLALNPDVTLDVNYVRDLVAALEAGPEYGAAMGRLWLAGVQDGGRQIDGTGLFIDRARHQYLRGHGEVDRGQYDQGGEIFGVDGAAPLFRREALLDAMIDGQVLDESYFLYMDDVDLTWRMRLFGWRSRYVPTATATHDRSFKPGSRRPISRAMRRHAVKNRYFTLLKNEARATWRRDWWRILGYDLRVLAYLLVFEQTSLPAYPMVWSARDRIHRWRTEIWSRVKVSDDEIRRWFG